VAPRATLEAPLCRLWQEVLGMGRGGIHDNFFHLGGHSLLAIQVISKLRAHYDFDLSLKAVFSHSNIFDIARIVLLQIHDKKGVGEMVKDRVKIK